jgi:hypothetical protein
MIIGTRQRLNNLSQDINVSINGKLFKEVDTKKTLGVLVDEDLCWDKQISKISKKASKGIGMLRRVKPYVPTKTLKHLYQALVQPSKSVKNLGVTLDRELTFDEHINNVVKLFIMSDFQS